MCVSQGNSKANMESRHVEGRRSLFRMKSDDSPRMLSKLIPHPPKDRPSWCSVDDSNEGTLGSVSPSSVRDELKLREHSFAASRPSEDVHSRSRSHLSRRIFRSGTAQVRKKSPFGQDIGGSGHRQAHSLSGELSGYSSSGSSGEDETYVSCEDFPVVRRKGGLPLHAMDLPRSSGADVRVHYTLQDAWEAAKKTTNFWDDWDFTADRFDSLTGSSCSIVSPSPPCSPAPSSARKGWHRRRASHLDRELSLPPQVLVD